MSEQTADPVQERTIKEEIPGTLTLCDMMMELMAQLVFPQGETRSIKDESPEVTFLRNCLRKFTLGGSWSDKLSRIFHNPSNDDIRLLNLARKLSLNETEVLVTSLALGVEQNAMIGRCIAFVQAPIGTSRPCLGLLNSVLAPVLRTNINVSNLLIAGRAVKTGLLEILNEDSPLPEQLIRLPIPLANTLSGVDYQWPGARELDNPVELSESVILTARKYGLPLNNQNNRVLLLRSSSQSEAQSVAAVIGKALSKSPLFLDMKKAALSGLGPYCLMRNTIPVFQYTLAPSDHETLPGIPGYNGAVIVTANSEGTFEYPSGTIVNWHIPQPDYEERLALWESYLPNNEHIKDIAKWHIYGTERIAQLSTIAQRIAESNFRNTPSKSDLSQAAFVSEGSGIGALAQLISTKVPEDALVLSKNIRRELELLLARCRNRESLSENLGVTLKARYQQGVRTLLVGPSGTGKTLAGSWLATQLNIPLYRVDLAAVTSKYIGETEKNLSQLLDKAEQEEVVLLFDEADSMFGKRTDIQDSNDRFANAQTNYLLQRIESYTGIVLMTSNSRMRFDAAFSRRIDMIVEFHAPKPEERRELWNCHLGDNHKLTHTQLNQLSTVADLCGGHIRNAVLTASILSQSENRALEYKDLQQGIKAEYKKLGKKIPVDLMK